MHWQQWKIKCVDQYLLNQALEIKFNHVAQSEQQLSKPIGENEWGSWVWGLGNDHGSRLCEQRPVAIRIMVGSPIAVVQGDGGSSD